MKNKVFAFMFMLIGTFALANISTTEADNKEELGCTSTTTTTTTTNTDGSSTTNTTTTVTCDTPQELVQFQAELKRLTNQ